MHEDLVRELRYIADIYRMTNNTNMKEYRLAVESADALEELSKPQNTVHLCTSCKYQYPECPADTGVVFGRGEGNDNICQCADYVAGIPSWIPVTERLPKHGERVLVFGGVTMYVAYYDKNKYGGESWHKLNSKNHHCNPTHWMPLPEPPKEEAK